MNTVRLGDVVDAVRGVTFPASELSNRRGPDLIACLTTSAVHEPLRWSTARFIPEKYLTSNTQLVRPGDVLLSTANSKPNVGISARVDVPPFESTFGAFVTLIRPGPTVDSQYLAYWFRSSRFLQAANSLASQTTNIANLRVSDLLAIEIPLPTIEEQRKLAAKVSGLVSAGVVLTAASNERRSAAHLLRLRLYTHAFLEIVPLTSTMLPGEAPVGWAWHTLTDLARLESGHTPSRGRPDWWGGDIPWIALPDIRRLDSRVAFETTETTNADGIKHSSARILPADTVVMSRTASVGFVTRMGRPMATSQDFVNWVCGPDLDPEFLMHLLIRSRDEIRALASGAIHKTVYVPTVKSFRVCIPPMAEQRRIVTELRERLATIDAMTIAIDAQLEAIDALPAALLRLAFEDLAA